MSVKKETVKIKNPADVALILKKWGRQKQENFLTVTLNGANEIIKVHHITKGLVNRTIVHPRECFHPAVKDYASSVIFAHNHPSGNVLPSAEDRSIADRLNKAGIILGFSVVDHIILSPEGYYYSFQKEGIITGDYSSEELKAFVAEIAGNKAI